MAVQANDSPAASDACRRCAVKKAVITIRKDRVCKDCFLKYTQTKIIKRMETFRVRSQDRGRTYLLPLSFGAGSSILLHVLSQYLRGQKDRSGRAAFTLHVLHVQHNGDAAARLDFVKASYPEHTYSIIGLADISPDSSLIHLFPSIACGGSIEQALSSCPTATSRADVINILRTRALVSFAKQHECECIVWGHGTTRLAEQTLAETAKGRGFALHLITADGMSPHGIPFYYPCRELLSSEITSFADLSDPPVAYEPKEDAQTVSSKQATIDSLMQHYFSSAEQEYPSIVANVVRTAAKLEGESLHLVEQQCELCEMPLDGNAPERSRLCYACVRILPS